MFKKTADLAEDDSPYTDMFVFEQFYMVLLSTFNEIRVTMTNPARAKKMNTSTMTIMVLEMTMMTNPTIMIMTRIMMTNTTKVIMTRIMMTNPTKAKKTKKMQTSIQAAMAVIPSTFGEFVVTMLKMLIST